MSSLGFCIVGSGMIARFHARALQEVPGARLVAVVSRQLEGGKKLIKELQDELQLGLIPVYAQLEEACQNPEVDVVIITTPSGAHLEPARIAASYGKHLVIEKPLEITTERCDAIIETADKNHVKLCTIFPSRFHEVNVLLKDAVQSQRFGRLTLAETTCKWWRSQAYYDEGGWKGTQALDGGGALMNQAIHSVDLLLWMMGPVQAVSGFTATLAHERIEVEDTAVATLKFCNGALGVIQAATSISPGFPKTIAVHGDKGSVVIEQEDILHWTFNPDRPEDQAIRTRFAQKTGQSGGASDPKAISHQGHARQLSDFVSAIRNKRQPLVDGREGRRAVELITAIYQSMQTQKIVYLKQS